MLKTAVIKKCREQDIDPDRPRSEQKYCLYSRDGSKLLGRHPTQDSAKNQEKAIQTRKHSRLQLVINYLRRELN